MGEMYRFMMMHTKYPDSLFRKYLEVLTKYHYRILDKVLNSISFLAQSNYSDNDLELTLKKPWICDVSRNGKGFLMDRVSFDRLLEPIVLNQVLGSEIPKCKEEVLRSSILKGIMVYHLDHLPEEEQDQIRKKNF